MPRFVTRDEFDQACEALWTEITYQNELPRRTDDEAKQIPSFCSLGRRYIDRCEKSWADEPADSESGQVETALHDMRKVAAIFIRGMIYCGIRSQKPTPQEFSFVPTYTVAHLNWEGDGITALYEGDALLMEGDYYHDKIDDKIEGFFQGLDHQGADYGRQDIYVSGDDFDDCNAPSGLDELKESYPWTEEAE